MTGPVSTFLEDELRTWVRRHGVVVWLDLDGHYTGFVDRLIARRAAGDLPYPVYALRGSYLELLLALDEVTGGLERPALLLHLPGCNEELVRETPLYEVYAAGVRYRKRLDTLVTEAASGRVSPDRIAAFKAGEGLSLDASDAWLADALDEARGGGLAAQLGLMSLPALVDDLLGQGLVAARMRDDEARAAVRDRLATLSGLPDRWREAVLTGGTERPADLAFAVTSWALSVEYVDDLARPPRDPRLLPARDLPRGVIDACRALATHLRERNSAFYQATADETEAWLADEVEAARAEDLGRIDTFRFEEDRVLEAALVALREERWSPALAWAAPRAAGGSFWLLADPSRRAAWQLVGDAAALGAALVAAGARLRAEGLEEAMDRYVAVGARADQAHRHLEQRRAALLTPQLPRFEALRASLDALRELWRTWADDLARDWSRLCRREGFLPPPPLQQRTLFDDVVRPLTEEPGVTALFLVDALRYEMADELARALEGTPGTTVSLRPRLAELPTITAVGMNVLAPVARGGRLWPVVRDGRFEGFSAGEFRVTGPETRQRAMADRVGGATCPWLTLAEVVRRDSASLRQAVARARLVVVHSEEIDAAGERGVGPAAFDQVMQTLRAAWRLLREAGVRRFVTTADHGFLLLDETTREAQPHGRIVDPRRRHVVSTVAADHSGEARVPLSQLGYEGTDGLHLMSPESTAVFRTPQRGADFVHGGASPQERVIPVLVITHRGAAGSDLQRYALQAEPREPVAGMLCLEARLTVVAQGALAFGGAREVELGLRAPDQPEVRVDLCQVRGGARLEAGALHATVGERFELFFRLLGPVDSRAIVELYHPGAAADVPALGLETRFPVTGAARRDAPPTGLRRETAWLDALPDPGARLVFGHLDAHGSVTEDEVARLLGGARAARRFALIFDELAARAPYEIRIEGVGGVKRYAREGGLR